MNDANEQAKQILADVTGKAKAKQDEITVWVKLEQAKVDKLQAIAKQLDAQVADLEAKLDEVKAKAQSLLGA